MFHSWGTTRVGCHDVPRGPKRHNDTPAMGTQAHLQCLVFGGGSHPWRRKSVERVTFTKQQTTLRPCLEAERSPNHSNAHPPHKHVRSEGRSSQRPGNRTNRIRVAVTYSDTGPIRHAPNAAPQAAGTGRRVVFEKPDKVRESRKAAGRQQRTERSDPWIQRRRSVHQESKRHTKRQQSGRQNL